MLNIFEIKQMFSIAHYSLKVSLFILLVLVAIAVYCQPTITKEDSLKYKLEQPKIALNIPVIDTSLFDINKDLEEQLISIDSILLVATENSANVKMAIAETNKFKYNREYIKWVYLNSIQLFYNWGYGNSLSNIDASNQTSVVAAQNVSAGYRVGINLVFPMGDLIGRSARLKSLFHETELARHKQDETRRMYKRVIIEDYFNLIANQKLLIVKSQDLESSRITAELALVEMRRGKIPPAELSRLRSILAIAEIGYEQAKRDFLSSYYKLETTLTVPLIKFRKKEAIKP